MREPSIQELVRIDLVAREQLGKDRYGTALFPYNGRSALRDAYEECLDMAVYLKQLLVEEGQYTLCTQEQPPPIPPEHRAARQLTDEEQAAVQSANVRLSEDYLSEGTL